MLPMRLSVGLVDFMDYASHIELANLAPIAHGFLQRQNYMQHSRVRPGKD
jgi:hypothetical protein